ncbi:MAG: hypothetical protein IKR17_04110 [Bacteroidales bacterium]|nr:hypothetical protein [Bacteroidales bacterium]
MKTTTILILLLLLSVAIFAQKQTLNEYVEQTQNYLPRKFNNQATLTKVSLDEQCLNERLELSDASLLNDLYTIIRDNYTRPTKLEIPIMQMCAAAKHHLAFLVYDKSGKYLGSLFFSHQRMLDALTTTINASKFIDAYVERMSKDLPHNVGDGRTLTKRFIYDNSNDVVCCFNVSRAYFDKLNESDIHALIYKDIARYVNDAKTSKINETLLLQMALSGRNLYYLFTTDGTEDVKMGKLPSFNIASAIGIDMEYDDGWTIKRTLHELDKGSEKACDPKKMTTYKGVASFDNERNLVNIEIWVNEGFDNCPEVDDDIILSSIRNTIVTPESDCYRALAYTGAGLNIRLIGVKSGKKVDVVITNDELAQMCDY